MDGANPRQGGAQFTSHHHTTTATFTSARFQPTQSVHAHLTAHAGPRAGGPPRPTKNLPIPYQHHQQRPRQPTVAQQVFNRLLENRFHPPGSLPPSHPDAEPPRVPLPLHVERARALTRRLEEAMRTVCEEEDDVMTDGGGEGDQTPSPPDYRSWRPLGGYHHQRVQPGVQRMGSVKRAAGDAVDGGRTAKKIKVEDLGEPAYGVRFRGDGGWGVEEPKYYDEAAHYV